MKRSKNHAGIVMLAVLVACVIIGIAESPLNAAPQFFSVNVPNEETTIQFILDLINTEAGATELKQSVNTSWTYSAAAAGPCILHVREDRQRSAPSDATTPAPPVRETFHYLIPVADIDFAPFGTHHVLDQHRVMHQTIFVNHGTIRRWKGDSPVMPQDASVEFAAPINFGKPYVNIFEAPIRLENALRHLAFICQSSSKPDTDFFRNGCGQAIFNCSR